MLKVCGAVFLAIGLAAGVALVVSPFGLLAPARSSIAAWVLFPGCFAAGSLLLALGTPSGAVAWLWKICAALLLALATASALGLALPLLGVVEAAGQTLSLWYVLFVAGAVGTACALVPSAPAASS
jgi:hypothetical protein